MCRPGKLEGVDVKAVMVYLDRCYGCLTCSLACAAAHSASGTITGAMRERVPGRILVEAAGKQPVPILCRHCDDAPCVNACMIGAMQQDPVTGLVSNEGHTQACAGCWMCIMACPYGAIVQAPRGERMALKCDGCRGRETPACVMACPNGALAYVEVDDFAGERRLKLAFCLAEDMTRDSRAYGG